MTITLQKLPSALSLYLGAAGTARRKPKGRPEIPALSVEMSGLKADAGKLAAYRAICGFAEGDTLPIIYPQIMATSLAMHLMASPTFPLPMLGLVHVRNHIEQVRPLRADESFDVRVATGESRDVKAGLEFDIDMSFSVGEQVVWRAVMTTLYRLPSTGKSGRSAPPPAPSSELAEYHSFDAPADIGRRYARVGGDYNPIHLYAGTAKLFGFPRAIAHGLWSMARCTALTQDRLGREPSVLDVQFKQPLLLPGKVAVKFNVKDGVVNFSLLARNASKTHLSGSLR